MMDVFKLRLLRLFENPLLAGSTILFLGNLITNVSNYLYHLAMGRMLGPSSYGILESLISLLYLMEIPLTTLGVVVVKYVSQFKGEGRYKAVGKLYLKLNSQLMIIGLGGLVAYFLFTPILAKILHLNDNFWLVMVGLMVFVTIFSGINRSVLQGLSKFFELSLSGIAEGVGKLLLSVGLVAVGLKVTGAMGAMLIAGVLGYAISKYFVNDRVKEYDLSENLGRQTIIKYSLPVFISMLSLTSLFSTDIILARYYLTGFEAGLYSALAVLGKIIFFASGSIGAVMFPLISEYKAKNQNYRKIFWQSLGIVAMISIGMSAVYFIAPKIVILMLYGADYLKAVPFLGLFAIFLSLYSLVNIFVSYYISINKSGLALLTLPAAVLQVFLIIFFHQDISQIAGVSIAVLGLLVLFFIWYHFFYEKEN